MATTEALQKYASRIKSVNAPVARKTKPALVQRYSDKIANVKIPSTIGGGAKPIGTLNAPANEAPTETINRISSPGVGMPNQIEIKQPTLPGLGMNEPEDPVNGIVAGMQQNTASSLDFQLQYKQQQDAKAAAARERNLGYVPAGAGASAGGGNDLGGDPNLSGLSAEQAANARHIINVGKQRGMSKGDIEIALMTALTESGLKNINYGDRDSVGLFQQRTSQGWGSLQQIMDPSYSTNKFFDALGGVKSRAANPWQVAQQVQRSFDPSGSNYLKWYKTAQGIMGSMVDANNGGAVASPTLRSNSSATWINQNNGKYHDYDQAYGAQCVDLYSFYTTGFVGGKRTGVMGAQDIWNSHDTGAYVRVAATSTPQMGDVAIWSGRTGAYLGGGYGHVAIVAQPNSNGTLRSLTAGQSAGNGVNGRTAIVNLSKSGLIGYLRPRKLIGG